MRPLTAPEQIPTLHSAGTFIAGVAASVALLYYGRLLCITLVVSVILAFLLEPFVMFAMRARLPRGVAAFAVCTIAILVLSLFTFGLVTQFANLAEDLPDYNQRMNVLVDRIATYLEHTERNLYTTLVPRRFQEKAAEPEAAQSSNKRRRREPAVPPPVPEVRIRQDRGTMMNYVAGYVSSLYHTALMISFVPFLVYFTLSWQDHIARTFLSIYPETHRLGAGNSWQSVADMARAYVMGNVILGLVISAVSCGIFSAWHLPYWLLMGFISGFFSLVPYVGLPLAMIPPLLSALMTYDTVAPYVAILLEVALLHLLALNLLYPAFVGARVRLNPLAVTIALMFWGTIWGGVGLVLAIPITAALKVYLDNTEALQGYGRLLGDQTSLRSFTPHREV